nr:hypothetical protein CFP56_15504 [Quercus suber]
MTAQFHGVQSQSSTSVRKREGGSVVVQPTEGMTKGGDDDVALKIIDGETLQTIEGNKVGEAQEINCVEVVDTLQPIQGIQKISDSLLPPINAPNNEGVTLESEISVPNSVSEADLFDLQIRGIDGALNTYGENDEIKGIKIDVINSHSISPPNQTMFDERERASPVGIRLTRGKQFTTTTNRGKNRQGIWGRAGGGLAVGNKNGRKRKEESLLVLPSKHQRVSTDEGESNYSMVEAEVQPRQSQ